MSRLDLTPPSRFRTSLPRILHRRRQDDNDNGAQRDRCETRDRHGRQIPSQPPTIDSGMAQPSLVVNMPAEVRYTKNQELVSTP
jgi:hypothetical protein